MRHHGVRAHYNYLYPLTSIEKHYIDKVKRFFTQYIPLLQDLQNTLRLAELSLGVTSSKVWLNEISGYALLMKVYNKELQSLTPSFRLNAMHATLIDGVARFESAANIILIKRSDILTVDLYNGVRSDMKAGTDKIDESVKEMKALEDSTFMPVQ